MKILQIILLFFILSIPTIGFTQSNLKELYNRQDEILTRLNDLTLLVKVQLENHEIRLRTVEKKAEAREAEVDVLQSRVKRKESVDETTQRIYGGLYTLGIALIVVTLTFLGQYILQAKRNTRVGMDKMNWEDPKNRKK